MRKPGDWIHGKYQVERVLGSGGMGTVYATKRRNQSRAAVKVLHPRFARDKAIVTRFVEEGYLANRVQHPTVVTILEDDIDEEGNFYLVMELLEGVDLTHFVGPPRVLMSTAQALNVAHQLLAALAVAHQKGIVHRDIKPANVMILRDGRVKLLDFGVAKALNPEGHSSIGDEDEEDDDEQGQVIGTDRYMAPEQGQGFLEAIDARTDLWAVGALLLALLSEQDPSAVPLWDQTYEDRAWSFSRLGKDVPPHVVQIISLALQPQKEKRWASAAAMRDAVQAAHADLYGPLSSEELAVLSGGEEVDSGVLSSRPEGAAVPVADPTVISRPSHPVPTPRASPSSSSLGEAPTLSGDGVARRRASPERAPTDRASTQAGFPEYAGERGEPKRRWGLPLGLMLVALLVLASTLLVLSRSGRNIEARGEPRDSASQGSASDAQDGVEIGNERKGHTAADRSAPVRSEPSASPAEHLKSEADASPTLPVQETDQAASQQPPQPSSPSPARPSPAGAPGFSPKAPGVTRKAPGSRARNEGSPPGVEGRGDDQETDQKTQSASEQEGPRTPQEDTCGDGLDQLFLVKDCE